MERFTRLEAIALPFPLSNIDTDQVVPARFLKKLRRDGFGQYLFNDLRFQSDGSENPEFPLNRPAYRSARIIVAGANFGCGSSREAAVWALHDYGFRAAIAPSFGDIFFNNSLKNGLLPIVLPPAVVLGLLSFLRASPGQRVSVDLPAQLVTLPDGSTCGFEVDAFAKECLVYGLDELEYTLSRLDEIVKFENAYKAKRLDV
jgi:3-isopropylmalate/(R)-2-methylmalate dehydratase small subunit